MDTIDFRNLARDCRSEPTRHKGGHAGRLRSNLPSVDCAGRLPLKFRARIAPDRVAEARYYGRHAASVTGPGDLPAT